MNNFVRTQWFAAVLMASVILPTLSAPAAASTLERIRQDGLLRCGTINSGAGVSEIDATGTWRGFFPDFCRAIAAAVVGDPNAVEWVEVNYVLRFEALNSDAFDVLMANTTWTTTRDSKLELAFTQPIYYDGQGFLAHKSLGANALGDVDKASVCVSRNTTTLRNLEELVETWYPGLQPLLFESLEGVYDSFFARECDLMTQDRVALVSQRLNRSSSESDDYVLFPDVVSKEPLGPVVREGDSQWFDLVQWVIYALILAEEHGITQANVDTFLESGNPEIRRLLGVDPGIGEMLGVPEDWAYRAISAVGNYGEIFARNVGRDSPLGMERGLNALWTEGGLIYSPPLR